MDELYTRLAATIHRSERRHFVILQKVEFTHTFRIQSNRNIVFFFVYVIRISLVYFMFVNLAASLRVITVAVVPLVWIKQQLRY